MSTHSTDTRELREDEHGNETDGRSRTRKAASKVASVNENGVLSMLLGGALLVRGVRSLSRSRGRAVAQSIAGAALLAFGLRQRRSGEAAETDTDTDADAEPKEEDVSDEAHAAKVQGGYEDDDENPRGVSGEPDVEHETDGDDVEFTTDQDLESSERPGLEDEAGVEDPRRSDHGDPEIDLSEAAMADEASEATGPSSTQAQPAETEGTEPEPTPEEDASHLAADASTGEDEDEPDPDAGPGEATAEAAEAEPENVADEIIEGEIDEEDREGVRTEGGAKVHTDTNESDMMDIDEDDVTNGDDPNEASSDSDQQSGSHLVDEDEDEE